MTIIHDIRSSKQYKELRKFLLAYTYGIIKNWLLEKFSGHTGGILDIKEYGLYESKEIVSGASKKSVNLYSRLSKHQNQLDYPRGKTMCWPTGGSMASDILWAEETALWMNWLELAEYMELEDKWHPSWGCYLTDVPKYLKKIKVINGYYRVSSQEDFKKVLSAGYPIIIWTDNIRHKDGFSYIKKRSGHLFVAYWYNKNGILIADPWESKKWICKWEHYEYLYNSKIAIENSKEIAKIEEAKEQALQLQESWFSRIEIYKNLRKVYKEKIALLVIRRLYGMNITKKMLL